MVGPGKPVERTREPRSQEQVVAPEYRLRTYVYRPVLGETEGVVVGLGVWEVVGKAGEGWGKDE